MTFSDAGFLCILMVKSKYSCTLGSVVNRCHFMNPHQMMPGAYSSLVFRTCIHGYMRTNVHPSVRMCVCTYVYVHTYVRDLLDSG